MKVKLNPHNLPSTPKDNKCPKCRRLITAWNGWVCRAGELICKLCRDA